MVSPAPRHVSAAGNGEGCLEVAVPADAGLGTVDVDACGTAGVMETLGIGMVEEGHFGCSDVMACLGLGARDVHWVAKMRPGRCSKIAASSGVVLISGGRFAIQSAVLSSLATSLPDPSSVLSHVASQLRVTLIVTSLAELHFSWLPRDHLRHWM